MSVPDPLSCVLKITKTNSENFLRHCNEEQRQLWNTDHASRAWTSFKNGYISMHIDSPRWGLDALKEAVCNQEDWERLKRTFGDARNC